MNRISLLALAVTTAVQVLAVAALAQDKEPADKDLTCQVYGGSYVLDNNDFKSLEDAGITRAKFAALAPTSKTRLQICDTRKLWRLVKSAGFDLKSGKFDDCDFNEHYKYFLPLYLSDSEAVAITPLQAELLHRQLAGTAKKCR
jgi:hypothetical protein